MGVLKRLPDYPPDALFMIGTYALTAMLVGAGGKNRARELPAAPLALSLPEARRALA